MISSRTHQLKNVRRVEGRAATVASFASRSPTSQRVPAPVVGRGGLEPPTYAEGGLSAAPNAPVISGTRSAAAAVMWYRFRPSTPDARIRAINGASEVRSLDLEAA
jgi:hypothetical protein